MSEELSAYTAYSKNQVPKKTSTKTSKRTNAKRNNGTVIKRQNGVQQVKKEKESNAGKMCSRADSGSCGSSYEDDSSEQTCGMDTTEQTYDSSDDDSISGDCGNCSDGSGDSHDSDNRGSSDDYYSDKDDDDEDSSGNNNDDGSRSGDGGSVSGNGVGDHSISNSDDAEDDSTARSDQFSEEFTPNSSSSSPEKMPTPPPVQRKAAPKRKNVEASSDLNNNNNNNEKPTAAKQQRQKAPSCPLVRPKAETAVKSCPLPRKTEPKTTGVRSKMADNMATGSQAVKSCPLPRRSEPLPQKQKNAAVAAPRRSLKTPQETEPKHKLENVLEQMPKKEVHLQNSLEEGKRVLLWLLNPVTPDTFYTQYWEKNACQVQRKRSQYFSQLISFKMIDEMLIRNHLEFTTNIDVTSYVNGERQTHNPDGRAMPPTVWGYYGDGCSIRILNPSTYLSGLRQVCTVLQEYFHCLVGANVYLTPPNSQGFAPHYDDIEAFVLQIEGRKRWRLYTPPLPSDVLGRHSSGNYKQEQLGKPIFDAVLEPGDILYFPRGTVHQAVTEQKQHSLHITLSVYQQQAYANLIEKLMPSVMENAIKHHLSLRRGLPLHTWHHLGLAHGGQQTEKRKQLIGEVTRLVQQYLVPSETQIDAAVDQLAKRFQHEALPPVVLPEEKKRTVFGSRSQTDKQGNCLADYELTDQTRVRLLRANVLRLVAEESSLRVYYYVDNALEYCKYEVNYMEIQPTEAAAVESLIKAYPNYLKIASLPLRNAERRVEVATALWEHGLLMTEKPFK